MHFCPDCFRAAVGNAEEAEVLLDMLEEETEIDESDFWLLLYVAELSFKNGMEYGQSHKMGYKLDT